MTRFDIFGFGTRAFDLFVVRLGDIVQDLQRAHRHVTRPAFMASLTFVRMLSGDETGLTSRPHNCLGVGNPIRLPSERLQPVPARQTLPLHCDHCLGRRCRHTQPGRAVRRAIAYDL